MRLSTILDVKVSNEHIRVLLEFSQGTNLIFDKCISTSLKFKRLSPNAKAPVHATEGSVGYEKCDVVTIDIALVLPAGVYSRIALRSSLAIKNMDVGAGVVDIDYRGNLKIVIMNHSMQNHLHIEPGDEIGQFILNRFDIPEIEEVFHIEHTERGKKGFGSSGN